MLRRDASLCGSAITSSAKKSLMKLSGPRDGRLFEERSPARCLSMLRLEIRNSLTTKIAKKLVENLQMKYICKLSHLTRKRERKIHQIMG